MNDPVSLELRLLDPAVRADPAAVGELLAPDFVEFGASGRVWQRDDMLAALAADPGESPPEVADLEATPLGPDVVLVTYRSVRPDRSTLRMSVWMRTEGRWRVRFHQGTPIG